MKRGLKVAGAAALASLWVASSAMATSYGFVNITHNGTPDVAGQLSVNVTEGGANQAWFTFYNTGPIQSSITEIYFDDGTLLGISSIVNGTGVYFTQGGQNGVNPADLPGGNNVIPAFEATQQFSTEATGNNGTGVDPGETVAILFNLIDNQTYADTIAALEDGSLRIGLHVRSIGPQGISDAFVNNGPPPSTPDGGASVLLLGLALLGVEGLRRRR